MIKIHSWSFIKDRLDRNHKCRRLTSALEMLNYKFEAFEELSNYPYGIGDKPMVKLRLVECE